MPAILKDIGKSVWENPHLVLALAALMWGGHTIVARASVGEVSPMLLMALRRTPVLPLGWGLSPPSRSNIRASGAAGAAGGGSGPQDGDARSRGHF